MSNYSFDDAVKQHLVSTLSYTIEFLNQHGLSWWMAFGSCLGTIRHQGFIPWDDDIDIHMPREDYEKLLMQKDLFEGNGYSIVSIEDKGYYLPMAKIIDKSTTLVESRDFDFVMGVFVDIFPVDFVDEIDERLSGEYVWTRMDYIDSFRKFTVRDYVFMIKNKQFNRVVNSIMGRVFGAPYIKKKLEGVKLFEKKLKEKSKNAKYAFSDGIFLDKTLFDGYSSAKFEGVEVRVPKDAEKYLKALYGDYMQLPPENERVSTHPHDYINLTEALSFQEIKKRKNKGENYVY